MTPLYIVLTLCSITCWDKEVRYGGPPALCAQEATQMAMVQAAALPPGTTLRRWGCVEGWKV